MKLLLKIRYDGGAYHGSQYQPGVPTVQGVLTEKVSQLFGFQCNVTGCSRTDAGVHALGYCATVEPTLEDMRGENWCSIPVEKIHRALNILLPCDVSVCGACAVPDDFHPRYKAVSKEYLYVINDSVYPDPFQRGRAYHLKRHLSDDSIKVMNDAAEALAGRHDYSAFMAQGSSVSDTVRTLFELSVKRADENTVHIVVRGDGFLYNMVRILAGTLLDTASGKISVDDIQNILESRDRTKAGFTAPAHGLYLRRVEYGEDIRFEAE